MNINVLLFGATAASVGKRSIQIEIDDDVLANVVFDRILTEHPLLAKHKLHFSLNQQYAAGDEIIRDGDELAIFTAVSGG